LTHSLFSSRAGRKREGEKGKKPGKEEKESGRQLQIPLYPLSFGAAGRKKERKVAGKEKKEKGKGAEDPHSFSRRSLRITSAEEEKRGKKREKERRSSKKKKGEGGGKVSLSLYRS